VPVSWAAMAGKRASRAAMARERVCAHEDSLVSVVGQWGVSRWRARGVLRLISSFWVAASRRLAACACYSAQPHWCVKVCAVQHALQTPLPGCGSASWRGGVLPLRANCLLVDNNGRPCAPACSVLLWVGLHSPVLAYEEFGCT